MTTTTKMAIGVGITAVAVAGYFCCTKMAASAKETQKDSFVSTVILLTEGDFTEEEQAAIKKQLDALSTDEIKRLNELLRKKVDDKNYPMTSQDKVLLAKLGLSNV